ncbi:DNA alkylation repair protein [Pedobacter sp. BS3]|uniref:DNA alkylation repair protein n=1 Tax=Pedobacter sp. BS3 TaxID=2567937 RepID=UPI0011EC907A|nr:DNA alkylation repair protein [Pedobacter sp. BS3]TZF83059.1 DNA alkylation repair protein [Pedobacter sp. BS3]
MKQLLDRLKQTEHGFKHIVEAGNQLLADQSLSHFDLAKTFLQDESYQTRMLGTYLLGQLSVQHTKALDILYHTVSKDENWRVQEMLAKAIDHYCRVTGYEKSLPVIKHWLAPPNPNTNRAVIEGLRIWTNRPYFKDNPQVAIALISPHKTSNSEYLRKTVGNALRDIRKKYPALVNQEIQRWDLTDKHTLSVKKLIEK